MKRIRGQIDALEKALNGDSDCRAILQQIAAVRGATNGLMSQVLESHLRESVAEEQYSKQFHQSIDDTIEMVRTYLK